MDKLWKKTELFMTESSSKYFFNSFKKKENLSVKQPDLSVKDCSPQLISAASSTQLTDLNYDCLTEICQYLDVPTQFSLYKSSEIIANKMLHGIWYSYYKNGFDMATFGKHPEAAQAENVAIVLKNFNKIKRTPIQVFQCFIKTSEFIELQHIKYLSIQCSEWTKIVDKTLPYKEFRRFPCLEELYLSNICIDFNDDECILPLKVLHLRNTVVLNDLDGKFLNLFFTENLEKLLILSKYSGILLNHFPEIAKCVALKELTLSIHHLYHPETLSGFLKLRALKILTLKWYDNLDYAFEDSQVLEAVLLKYFEDPTSDIKELMMQGVQVNIFASHRYLTHIKSLQWIVRKTLLIKPDGRVVWLTGFDKLRTAFMDFLQTNKELRHIVVNDNVYFNGRQWSSFVKFVESCNSDREEWLKLDINFGKEESQIYRRSNYQTLADNSVRFFIETRTSKHRYIYES